jgi:uncharacterized protein (UPF0261 family)
MTRILLIGTLDTKLEEYLYLRKQIYELANPTQKKSLEVILIDCGGKKTKHPFIGKTQSELVAQYGVKGKEPGTMGRGKMIQYMINCTVAFVKYYMQSYAVQYVIFPYSKVHTNNS